MREYHVQIDARVGTVTTAGTSTGRGRVSWNFFWAILPLAMTFEDKATGLLPAPLSALGFWLLAVVVFAAFVSDHKYTGVFRNILIGWKNYVETMRH